MAKLTQDEFAHVSKTFFDRLSQQMSCASCNDLYEDEFPKSVIQKFNNDQKVFEEWQKEICELFKIPLNPISKGCAMALFKCTVCAPKIMCTLLRYEPKETLEEQLKRPPIGCVESLKEVSPKWEVYTGDQSWPAAVYAQSPEDE
jgi:hypothetical protein